MKGLLLLRACRLALIAGRIRRRSVEEVADQMCRSRWLVSGIAPDQAHRAARLACRCVWLVLGGLNTCLTRSLVAGALLSDRPDVMLHIGFRPSTDPTKQLDGHAWLSIGTQPLDRVSPDSCGAHNFEEVISFPLRRSPDHHAM